MSRDDEPTPRLVVPEREPCPFCRNLAGRESPQSGPCAMVAQDELTFTFVNPASLGGMPGHLLVIPRRHVETVFELTSAEQAALMQTTVTAARVVRTVLDPEGVLLVQRNGIAAGQEVPHVHVHVIPRSADAPYPPTEWVPRTPAADRLELAARLTARWQAE